MARREELSDEQWAILKPLFPEPRKRPDGRGRPRRDTREVLNGILWVLRSGARWHDMPDRFPAYQTCHRRFQEWTRSGLIRHALESCSSTGRSKNPEIRRSPYHHPFNGARTPTDFS